MRIRWIALFAIVAFSVAAFERSSSLALISMFGCLILTAMRRIEGAINGMTNTTRHLGLETKHVGHIVATAVDMTPRPDCRKPCSPEVAERSRRAVAAE